VAINDTYYSDNHATTCTAANGYYCTVTATLWFNIDQLGQPLDIEIVGGGFLARVFDSRVGASSVAAHRAAA
jgi:hypothetical protein